MRTLKCVWPPTRAPEMTGMAWRFHLRPRSSSGSNAAVNSQDRRATIMVPAFHVFAGVSQAIRLLCNSAFRTHNRSMATASKTPDSKRHPHQAEAKRRSRRKRCARARAPVRARRRLPLTRSRENLGEYIWLCFETARSTTSRGLLSRHGRRRRSNPSVNDAITGHRPTWPLGKRTARMHTPHGIRVEDDYGAVSRRVRSLMARAGRSDIDTPADEWRSTRCTCRTAPPDRDQGAV